MKRTRFVLSILLLLTWLANAPSPVLGRATNPPHLGYGVHFAPNTNVNPSLVSALGMDWVKIYDPGMAALFPGKRVLYRMDLHWPNDWTAFRSDVMSAARALAGLPITAVEVGNEPNLINEWIQTPNAWQYTQMLRVAYTEIKAAAPDMIVVSGGLAPTITTPGRGAVNDLEFAQEMLDNGAGQWLDAFGYHPYGYDQAPEVSPDAHELVFRRTERLRAIMEAHGVFKQVWLTEFGWLRDPGEDGVSCSENDPEFKGFSWLRVSGQTQANYLVRAFQYADAHWPWVGPMFVWNLNWSQQPGLGDCNQMRWFALLHKDGSPTVAFGRLQQLEHHVSDYLPHLELHADAMSVTVSLACLHRVAVGSFTIENTGYPAPTVLTIEPANGPDPPFAEVAPSRARAGDMVGVFVNPAGLHTPGQYTIHVNVRAVINGRPLSQQVQGYVVVQQSDLICG